MSAKNNTDLGEFIPISKPAISGLEVDFVKDAVASTWVSSLGEYIEKFEDGFAKFCEADYAVTVFNGTVALHLALAAHDIGPGDEVIVPDLSFIATANAVLYTGAKPVFVDIDSRSLCIDPEEIIKHITPRTKAIIPVHLYGHPSDMQAVMKIAGDHDIMVLEDAAEAHGARAHGRRVGSWGDCSAFSFYGNKILTTGEGGMITTNNAGLNARLRHLRDHAMSKTQRYWHETMGYNYRMTNLQAALGYAQLLRIDAFMKRRREIFDIYSENLSGIEGLTLNSAYPWAEPTYWLVCLELVGRFDGRRDALMSYLKSRQIDSRPYFFPMSEMPYIQEKADTPVSARKSGQGLNLPTYFDLTDEQVVYICEVIREFL